MTKELLHFQINFDTISTIAPEVWISISGPTYSISVLVIATPSDRLIKNRNKTNLWFDTLRSILLQNPASNFLLETRRWQLCCSDDSWLSFISEIYNKYRHLICIKYRCPILAVTNWIDYYVINWCLCSVALHFCLTKTFWSNRLGYFLICVE